MQIKLPRYSFWDVQNEKFDPIALREALTPRFTRQEMARRMDISETYLRELELGVMIKEWPEHRKKDFLREIALWKKNPDTKPRKHWGRRPGFRADGSQVPAKPCCQHAVHA